MTPEKETMRARLNQDAQKAWELAREKAVGRGAQPPPMPPPLQAKDIEYPKWMYRADGKAKLGYESRLFVDEAEHKAAGNGWTETPPTKKE